MKKHFTPVLLFLIVTSFPGFAQNIDPNGGAYNLNAGDAQHPCISKEEYRMIEQQCAENRRMLGLEIPANRSTNLTAMSWPLRAAANLPDCSYYFISAGVDHDSTTAIKDYNCGSRTYNGHNGTDIAIFPYPFYKMDSNQVEVIAAAPGTILYKSDGNFDKNCAGNNLTANAIIISHADGSQSHYWHMKSGSVTSKIVGQTVVAGEYLGVVGSSGSSSGPHLHFEIWNGSTVSSLIDPFSGTCNTWNASSWWATQKPYYEPAVVKVSANTTDIVLPACPATETPNEASSFTIPFQGPGLNPGYAKFYAFVRDETAGTTATLSILNPNGTTYLSWTRNCNTTYHTSYWSYSKLLPTTPGTYTFNATYNGATCSTSFDIQGPLNINEATTSEFKIYPNPASSSVNIATDKNIAGTLSITDVAGRKMKSMQLSSAMIEISTAEFPTGLYFVTLNRGTETTTQKLLICRE